MLAGPGGLIQPMRMTPRKAQSARADAKRKSAHGAVAAELCEIFIMRRDDHDVRADVIGVIRTE